MSSGARKALLLIPCAVLIDGALAHENEDGALAEVIVYGRAEEMLGLAESASEGIVGYADLDLAPLLRVGELVEVVPGMVATQHSGTGKANQYFLRGFNLDHGTDFAVSADGVPVNFRTHGHGQGYLDLNFLIPELVETVTYRKGPYRAQDGDFSSAGTAEFRFHDRLDSKLLGATVGQYDYVRGLAAGTFDTAAGALTGAIDLTGYAGPWALDEDLSQAKLYGSLSTEVGTGTAKLSFLGYSADWNATDQVPRRAIESGLIDRLGTIDPDLGGSTDRYSLTGSVEFESWSATAYVIDYDFSLYSNFTYLLADPVDGDEFEQVDQRTVAGVLVRGHRHWPGARVPLTLSWGGDLRHDAIDEVGLYPTVSRSRVGVVRDDTVDEFSASAWGDLAWQLGDRLRASLGARIDQYHWDVDARLAENSGSGSDTLVSPKLNIAYRAGDNAEIYLNWGRGFHSNDVRGATATIDPATGDPVGSVETLVPSEGAEIGARIERGGRFNATASLFWLELDSELVFVGDGGATEPNDGTTRSGVELAAFWQPADWLAANLAWTYVDAKFKVDQGGGWEIPGAVDSALTFGLNAAWQNNLFASAKLRYLGDAPLVEDGSVRSDDSLIVNASLGYRWNRTEMRLDAFNLFDSSDDDIAYYYASRLAGEPAAGVEDIHFHPFEPRVLRLSVAYHWD